MAYYDEKKGIVLSEEDKQIFAECEPQRTLVFTWKGIASDYKLYSEHLKESFRERDEDVRSKLWAN